MSLYSACAAPHDTVVCMSPFNCAFSYRTIPTSTGVDGCQTSHWEGGGVGGWGGGGGGEVSSHRAEGRVGHSCTVDPSW